VTAGESTASPAATARTASTTWGGGRVLEQEAAGAGAQRGDDVIVEPEGGEDQNALARQLSGRLDAVHLGHADVHEHDVGGVLLGCRDGLGSGAGLGDDLDVACRFKHGLEAGAHHRLVIGDDDSQAGHAIRSS